MKKFRVNHYDSAAALERALNSAHEAGYHPFNFLPETDGGGYVMFARPEREVTKDLTEAQSLVQGLLGGTMSDDDIAAALGRSSD